MTSSIPAVATRPAEGSALQAVLLDMDGTLVETEDLWWEAEVEVFAELGHTLAEEHRSVVIGGPMTRSAAYLIKVTGARITVPEVSRRLNATFAEKIDGEVPLTPGARRLLTELAAHGVPAALVSATHRRIMDSVLGSLGRENFAVTIAGDEVERTKPHPEPYLTAARRLGAEPHRCVVVEDTATGVTSAETAGCPVVVVPSLSEIPPAAGRTIVGSLEDVDLPFLRSLIAPAHRR
ncbi:HAD family phosphatase [Streptomyces chumphonensis]|uniref:HAD family phosphatase n=1 Tax=Streptomyces chumphonensis TaxID=1214925 RepID=A0A927EY60_9ACTN|nr:HAD family phosphatase [Streptomyces chumphonensis]MBD3931553.1 HAD family phosphatase [Streptomyces chumphonensis]